MKVSLWANEAGNVHNGDTNVAWSRAPGEEETWVLAERMSSGDKAHAIFPVKTQFFNSVSATGNILNSITNASRKYHLVHSSLLLHVSCRCNSHNWINKKRVDALHAGAAITIHPSI